MQKIMFCLSYFPNITVRTNGTQLMWNCKHHDQTTGSFNVFDLVYPAENPADPSKLLIGFESGFLSLWDLGTKKQEEHYR